MKTARRFVLDADVFIQAYRSYYGFEICPGFWRALVEQQRSGRVLSVEQVKAELDHGADDLTTWVAKMLPAVCFAPTNDPATMRGFAEAQRWVNAQARYTAEAKAQFASVADGWLPAYALSRHLVVVTCERPEPGSKKIVKIPDVCGALGVKWSNTFDMLKELGVSFSLKP